MKTTLSLMRQKYSTDILKTEPAVGYSLFTHSLCFGVDVVPCLESPLQLQRPPVFYFPTFSCDWSASLKLSEAYQ